MGITSTPGVLLFFIDKTVFLISKIVRGSLVFHVGVYLLLFQKKKKKKHLSNYYLNYDQKYLRLNLNNSQLKELINL